MRQGFHPLNEMKIPIRKSLEPSLFSAGMAGRSPDSRVLRNGGFSLVEVAIAIAIISVAFIPILNLVPMGMNNFRNSSDTSIGAQISQQVVNQIQETDFTTLLTAKQPTLYFDAYGGALPSANGALYNVCVRVSQAPVLPGAQSGNQNLATVIVQIANNPGNRALQVDPITNLWASQPGVSMRTYSTVVSGYNTSGNQ